MPNLRLYNNPWTQDDCGPFVPGINSSGALTRVTEALLGRGGFSQTLGDRPALSFRVAGKAENAEYLREGLILKAQSWGIEFMDDKYTEWILKDISRGMVANTPGESISLTFIPLADHLLDSYTIWPQQGASVPPNDDGRESIFRLVDRTVFSMYSPLFITSGGSPYSPDGGTPMFQRPSDANTWAWQDDTFQIEMAGATLGEILDEIARQTGLRWYYSNGSNIGAACANPDGPTLSISRYNIHFAPEEGGQYAVPAILTEGLDFNDCAVARNIACGDNQSFRIGEGESDWSDVAGSTIDSYEGGVWVPEWGANDAKELQVSGVSTVGIVLNFGQGILPWSGSVYVMNTGANDIRVIIGPFGNNVILQPGESTPKPFVVENIAGTSARQIRIQSVTSGQTINFTAWRPQIVPTATHQPFNPSCQSTVFAQPRRKVMSAGSDRSLRDRFTCLQPLAQFEEITRGVQGTLLKEIDGARSAQGSDCWVELGSPFTAITQEDDGLTCFGPVNTGFPRWVRLDGDAPAADAIPNDGDFVGEDIARVWSCISDDGAGNEIVEYLVANHEILDTEAPNRVLVEGMSTTDVGCVTMGMNIAAASLNSIPQKICTNELVEKYGEITRSSLYDDISPLVNLAESRDNGGGDPTFGRLAGRPGYNPLGSSAFRDMPDVFDKYLAGSALDTYSIIPSAGDGGIYGSSMIRFDAEALGTAIISFNDYSNTTSNQQNNPVSMWLRFKVNSGSLDISFIGIDDNVIDTGEGPLQGSFDDGDGQPFWRELVFATSEKVKEIRFHSPSFETEVDYDAICITNAVREIPYQAKMGPNHLWEEAVRDLRAESQRTGWNISGVDVIVDETQNPQWWDLGEPGVVANVQLPIDAQPPGDDSMLLMQVTALDFEFAPSCAGQPSVHPIRTYSLGDTPPDVRNYIGDSLRFRRSGG